MEDGRIQTTPDLPQDILMDIFTTFEIPDLVRAGSVCASWRSAYQTLRNHGLYKHSQTPCLFYTSESDAENTARLYSLVEKKVYRLALPDPPIRTRTLIGSSPQGLLVTVDDRSEMHLLNPITGQQIALPSVITIKQVKPIYDGSGVLRMYRYSNHVLEPPSDRPLSELRHQLHHKAFVFSLSDDASSSQGGGGGGEGYIVVLIHNPSCQLSVARVGADSWTWLPMPPHTSYADCMYKDGVMYAVTFKGQIHGFHLTSHAPVATMKMIMEEPMTLRYLSTYIIQAPCGDLLQVWRKFNYYDLESTPNTTVFWITRKIRVYKVDAAMNVLEPTSCLHGHALFLGHNQSLCLSTEEYPALKANHAYFTDDNKIWTMGLQNKRRDLGILNLDNNSREELVSPQLWSNCPAPIWITPNLTEISFPLDN
ncbi:hypothetical protein ZWY2020_009662 [Hordeum vulgare]|nr:hypothetical protein ZWY2020_009662 [Hordeum vulgare]